MSAIATYRLCNPVQAKPLIDAIWRNAKGWLMGNGSPLVVTLRQETRSLAQNARLWAMLGDISEQVVWHGRKLSPESWKCIFSASLAKQDVVPGLNNDFVVLGQSTSKMTKAEMCDLQTLMEAFGVEHNVVFKMADVWGDE